MVTQKNIVKVLDTLLKQKHLFKHTALTEVSTHYNTPFHVLISCILSLRTKDQVTGPASLRLFQLADTPQNILKLHLHHIEKAIYPVGFYKTKAKTIKRICTTILEKHNGKVPDTLEELLTLKGVGRKTANIVMVYGHGKEGMPVDTHCHRWPNRMGWIKTKTPEQTEMQLRALIPKKYWKIFNDLIVQFGQHVCTPISPHCSSCPIQKYCLQIGVIRNR